MPLGKNAPLQLGEWRAARGQGGKGAINISPLASSLSPKPPFEGGTPLADINHQQATGKPSPVCLVPLVYLVCLVFWLNETNQINKTNQRNQADQTDQ